MLYHFGAALIYAGLNHQATLHRTSSRDEAIEIERQFKEGFRNRRVPWHLIEDKTEQLAVHEIDDFFSVNRGTYAVVIFGESHDLSKYWTAPPRIYSKRF